jgi:hydroxymethylbilane synthase
LNNQKIIIGSRGSKLALWQANYVRDRLDLLNVKSEIKIIKTKGDKIQHLSFDKIEGKGFFTKEIENELLNGSIDLAVHSLKDLETSQPLGLSIGAVPIRENPSDTLLINNESVDKSQPLNLIQNAVVGTSSARRKNQLLFFRNDLNIEDLRGNVPTRVQKLSSGKYDAIVLAKAGLNRLKIDLSDFSVLDLSPSEFIPAPAQGALGLQIRDADLKLKTILSSLNDQSSLEDVSFEREILNKSGGGCHSPFGAFSKLDIEGNRTTWVTYAQNASQIPFRFVTKSLDPISIVERMRRKVESKNIWISRELIKNSSFYKLLTNLNCKIEGISLIDKKIIKINQLPKCEWVFINSAYALDSIIHLKEQLKFKKIAAFGNATANYIQKNDLNISFTGEGSPQNVADNFASCIKDSEVAYFPCSDKSLGTVQKRIPKKNKEVHVTYHTVLLNHTLFNYDILVFTSPSNVEAFLLNNKFKNQIIFSIGPSTTKALQEAGVKEVHQSYESSELALAETICSVI